MVEIKRANLIDMLKEKIVNGRTKTEHLEKENNNLKRKRER